MITTDFHTHTLYCDGNNTPRELVLAAIEKKMTAIGFTGHAYTSFDTEWCMSLENTEKYISDIKELKKEFANSINIYCGAEWDYFSEGPSVKFEYRIGSVHYIERDVIRKTVDENKDNFSALVNMLYGGDYYACAEDYQRNVGNVLEKTGADIVGHFDLITKFNEGNLLFDTDNERYIRAWKNAADNLLKYKKPFEINTGAISRGYRTKPYPAIDIIDYIGKRGGTFILSSDSHSVNTLLFGFDEWEKYLTDKGYMLVDTVC